MAMMPLVDNCQSWASNASRIQAFVAKCEATKGPFRYLGKTSGDSDRFLQWYAQVDPDAANEMSLVLKMLLTPENIAKIEQCTGVPVVVPMWMKTQIRIPSAIWYRFVESMGRVGSILRWQGTVSEKDMPASQAMAFQAWWAQHDPDGFAAFQVLMGERGTPTLGWLEEMVSGGAPAPLLPRDFPRQLYGFFVENDGKYPPTGELVGKGSGLLAWAAENWWMVGLGSVGGILFGNWLVKRRKRRRLERGVTIPAPPPVPNPFEGTPGTPLRVVLKAGVFELTPLMTKRTVASVRGQMRRVNKFKVSAGGRNIGELQRSSGKRRWRAKSRHGISKWSNSRAALLEWLRDGAGAEAAEKVAKKIRVTKRAPAPAVAPEIVVTTPEMIVSTPAAQAEAAEAVTEAVVENAIRAAIERSGFSAS